jgi:hypothetical protein
LKNFGPVSDCVELEPSPLLAGHADGAAGLGHWTNVTALSVSAHSGWLEKRGSNRLRSGSYSIGVEHNEAIAK